ncbi:MAG: TIGR02270 family protein [Zoogloeaceae bacterium]|nr:TIGR02270 family protein [Zoogloeaceae bacterium]
MSTSEAAAEVKAPPVPRVLPALVAQGADEVVFLYGQRARMLEQSHVGLPDLARLDARLQAQLDGLRLAGVAAWAACDAHLAAQDAGAVFALMVLALEADQTEWAAHLLALAEGRFAGAEAALIAAYGWVSADFLRGSVRRLLADDSALSRRIGLAACVAHRVDPGQALLRAVKDPDSQLRAAGLAWVATCGRVDLLPDCAAALSDADEGCRLAAATSIASLAPTSDALKVLAELACTPGRTGDLALDALCRAAEPSVAQRVFQRLAREAPGEMRRLLRGVGVAGDPQYGPWLIRQMADPAWARVAGEAFALMTGVDLERAGLAGPAAPGAAAGPTDDPADEDVARDPDEGLPWPDAPQVAAWWQEKGGQFAPGGRYFLGEPLSAGICRHALAEGGLPKRRLAAAHLLGLAPGGVAFNCLAPAWRQQRWLKALG